MVNLYLNVKEREVTAAVYCDLLKIFYHVNHGILLCKLEVYLLRGSVLSWFRSYPNEGKLCYWTERNPVSKRINDSQNLVYHLHLRIFIAFNDNLYLIFVTSFSQSCSFYCLIRVCLYCFFHGVVYKYLFYILYFDFITSLGKMLFVVCYVLFVLPICLQIFIFLFFVRSTIIVCYEVHTFGIYII